jgi:hypothetical protein
MQAARVTWVVGWSWTWVVKKGTWHTWLAYEWLEKQLDLKL